MTTNRVPCGPDCPICAAFGPTAHGAPELVKVQIYTWVDPVTDRTYHFNASAMLDDAEAGRSHPERVVFQIVKADVDLIIRSRGVDLEYAKRLTTEQLLRPVVAIYNPADGTTLTVDGHHRYVRWWQLGLRKGMMYRYHPGEWEPYLLRLPPEQSAALRREVTQVDPDEVPSDQKPLTEDN